MGVKKHVFEKAIITILFMLIYILITPIFAMDIEEKNVSAYIPVSCTGKNTEEVFTYKLNSENMELQEIEKLSLSLKDGEEDVFIISYTCPGTYHYTITQNKGTDTKTKYDDTIYEVDVYITEDESGRLFAEPILYINGGTEKKEEASFVNEKEKQTSSGQDNNATPVQMSSGQENDANPVHTDDTSVLLFYIEMMIISGMILLWGVKNAYDHNHKKN